jgi:hypothetical protein
MMLSTAYRLTIQLPEPLTTSLEHGSELPTSPTDCIASPWTELPFELDLPEITPLSCEVPHSTSAELFSKELDSLHELESMEFLCSGDEASSLLDLDLDAELSALDEAVADFSDDEKMDADEDAGHCSGDDLTLFEETQLLLAEAESTISYAAEQHSTHRRRLETIARSPPSPPHYSQEQRVPTQQQVVEVRCEQSSTSRRKPVSVTAATASSSSSSSALAFKVPSKPFNPSALPNSPTSSTVRCLSPAAGIVRRHRAAGSSSLRKHMKRASLPEPFRLQQHRGSVRRSKQAASLPAPQVSAVQLSPLRLSAPAPHSSPLSDRLRSELAAAGIDALVLQQQLARRRKQPVSPASPATAQPTATFTPTQSTLKSEVAASATAPKSNRVTPLTKIGFSAVHIERTFSREQVVVVTGVETDEFVDIMC